MVEHIIEQTAQKVKENQNLQNTDYLDAEHRVKASTIKKNVLRRKMELDSLGEELRVLYVAMTRAKQRLYVTWSRNRVDYHNQLQPRYLTPFMKPLLHFFEVLA